uniref:Uncharacterized protein n=1 Tax=Avena sativa TaxID=4498 RepID=A0ACD5VQZ7_AVESA
MTYTNLHFYKVEIFYVAVDKICVEMDHRFCEASMEILIIPVSTASVERAFSAMKIIKSKLRNKLKNKWFNDWMICYIEREIFRQPDSGVIAQRFQAMKKRRKHLPRRARAN